MNPTRRSLLQLAPIASIASGASLGWVGRGALAAPVPRELRIGASAALSGPAAVLGQRFHAGARAAFAALREQGGLRGRSIVMDLRDDGYEPDRAEANTRALVEDARVLALFGYIGTPTSRVALPYAKRQQIAFVAPYSGAAMLRDPAQTEVINLRPSYHDEGRVLVEAMRARRVRRLRVLYQADLFGRSGLEAVRETAAGAGIEVDMIASVQRNSNEVEDAAATLLRAPHPDGLLLISTYDTCAAFVRRARRTGYAGRFYLLSFTGFEPLRQALDRDMRRISMTQVVPDAQDANLPVVSDYQRAMRQTGDAMLDAISLEGFLAARLLIEGLRRVSGEPTRASLLAALRGLGPVNLGGFRVPAVDDPQPRRWVGLRG